jgi:hypothetical protein
MMSLLKFGTYVFPQGFRFIRREPEIFANPIPLQGIHGEYATRFFRGGKTLTIEGTIGATGQVDSAGHYYSTIDDTDAEMNLMAAQLRSGYQKFTAGYIDGRYLNCQLKSMKVAPIPGTNRVAREVSIELYAPDPRWLGIVRSAHFDHNCTWVSGDGPGAGSSLTVYGSAIMYPRFVFEGPINTGGLFWSIGIQQHNHWYPWDTFFVGQVIMIQTQPPVDPWIASGEEFIIDCDPFNRANAFTINGDSALGWARMHGVGYSPNDTNSNLGGSDECFPFFYPTQAQANATLSGDDLTPPDFVAEHLPASGFDVHWQEAWAF